jgi:DNA-binding transcriptional MerR regulator
MKLIGENLGFQAKEACAFSGVGYKRLDNWARTGFIRPSLAAPDEDTHRFRYYSFNDVVALAVARKLRDTGFSLRALQRIKTMGFQAQSPDFLR